MSSLLLHGVCKVFEERTSRCRACPGYVFLDNAARAEANKEMRAISLLLKPLLPLTTTSTDASLPTILAHMG